MNNDIIIIGSYPSDDVQKQYLIDCINSLKPLKKEIILVTHCPITIKIQNMVDYFIYDSNNFLISDWEGFGNAHQCGMGNIEWSTHFSSDHMITNIINWYNGFSLAKSLGKDLAYYIESDTLFSKKDYHRFEYVRDLLISQNKKAYFEVEKGRWPNDETSFNCLLELFVANPDFLLRTIDWVNDSKNYFDNIRKNNISDSGGHTLTSSIESYVFYYLNKTDDVIFSVLEDGVGSGTSNLFPNMKLHLHNNTSFCLIKNTIKLVFNKNFPHTPAIGGVNYTGDLQTYRYEVYEEEKVIFSSSHISLSDEKYNFHKLPDIKDGANYEVKIYCIINQKDELITSEKYNLESARVMSTINHWNENG